MFNLGKIVVTTYQDLLGMPGLQIPSFSTEGVPIMVAPTVGDKGLLTWEFDITEENIKDVKNRFMDSGGNKYVVKMTAIPIPNPFKDIKKQEAAQKVLIETTAATRKAYKEATKEVERLTKLFVEVSEKVINQEGAYEFKAKESASNTGEAPEVPKKLLDARKELDMVITKKQEAEKKADALRLKLG